MGTVANKLTVTKKYDYSVYKYGTKTMKSKRALHEVKVFHISKEEVEKISQAAFDKLDPRDKQTINILGYLPAKPVFKKR